MEEVFQELSTTIGIPLPVLLGIVVLVMFLGFGSFFWRSVGSSWGFLLGVIPVAFGVLLGVFPVWVLFIGAIPVLSVLYRSFYGFGSTEEDEEVLETPRAIKVLETPKVPSSKDKSRSKPPWAK